METSASYEARSAPLSYPTESRGAVAIPRLAGFGATLSPERVAARVRNPPPADFPRGYQEWDRQAHNPIYSGP